MKNSTGFQQASRVEVFKTTKLAGCQNYQEEAGVPPHSFPAMSIQPSKSTATKLDENDPDNHL